MLGEGRKLYSTIGTQGKERNYGNSSTVVIYRNVKYSGTVARLMIYIKTYGRSWFTTLMIPWMSQFHDCLLELLGFFYFILFTPLHCFIGLILLLIRQSRVYLVKKYYPTALVALEDLSPRHVFVGKSLKMVTTIVMLKGKLDVRKLRSYFTTKSLKSCSILRKKIQKNSLGLCVFVDSEIFNIERHIVEAPKEFLKYFVMDEIGQKGKSALQTFVTACASEMLDADSPPWKISIIPHPVYNKEKTCCVLRFHCSLLNDPHVNQSLDNIFNQCIYQDEDYLLPNNQHQNTNLDFLRVANNSFSNFYLNESQYEPTCPENSIPLGLTETEEGRRFQDEVHFEEPTMIVYKCTVKMSKYLQGWIYSNLYVSRSDVKTWINLQKKQFEFHGKSAIVKSILYEFFVFIKKMINTLKSVTQSSQWSDLKKMMELLVIILRAVCFIPIEILSCIIVQHPTSGLRRTKKSQIRRIAWTPPISRDLLKNIKCQTGASTRAIVLTAIAASLKDYYSETSLPNPKSLGVTVPFVSRDLLALNGFATLDLPTEQIGSIPEQLKKVDTRLKSFAQFKLVGNYYMIRYIPYLLPRSLANFVIQKIFQRYPISFTKIDLQPTSSFYLPHMSLWDLPVEEFCFWCPPQSDFCVSIMLVNYAQILRISVLSPMDNLDTALTQRFLQNLNQIAEKVGVDKSLIFSRKNSPSSSNLPSHCSSPIVTRSGIRQTL